jgi:peptidoglycan/LPS O-acetylase OafA/YrhL
MGWLGVPIFFVLSGFLIHYTYCRSQNPSVGQFWLRRFGRIYPPYLVALTVLALLSGHLWRARGQTNFLHHALLIHNFRYDFIFGINGSFWSLAAEAQYYLLYPLLLSIRNVVGMPTVLGMALAVTVAIPWLTSAGVIPATPDATAGLMMPKRYFEWILGMYVADRLLAGRTALGIPAVGSWLCFLGAIVAERVNSLDVWIMPLAGLGTAIWIERVVRTPGKVRGIERLLIPIGIVSYSLYLWHQPIIAEVIKRILQNEAAIRALPEPAVVLIALGVAAVTSALVAVGSFRLTEVPSMELTKKLVKRLAGKPRQDGVAPVQKRAA